MIIDAIKANGDKYLSLLNGCKRLIVKEIASYLFYICQDLSKI